MAPRPRSAGWLAERFEVSGRTMQRDIAALQRCGVPIYAELGRGGGYVLDKSATLPPLNLTAEEAATVATALRRLAGTPLQDAARSALQKLVAVIPEPELARADRVAARVHLVGYPPLAEASPVLRVVAAAASEGRVLRLSYTDRYGNAAQRLVEALGYLGGRRHWYLLAWCRSVGRPCVLRTDRIAAAEATDEVASPRTFDPAWLDIPRPLVSQLTLKPRQGGVATVREPGRAPHAGYPAGALFDEGVFMSATTNGVGWFEIATDNLETTERFYGDVFGWTFADAKDHGDIRYRIVTTPGEDTLKGGILATEGGRLTGHDGLIPNYAAFRVVVDDVAEACRRSEEAGGKVLMQPTTVPNGVVVATVQDPLGNLVGLCTTPIAASY